MGGLQYTSESTPTTADTIIPSLGWDFELHQPKIVSNTDDSPTPPLTETDEPRKTNFFAPLKSKITQHNQEELRPDLCVGNVLACDTNKLATIRRPHNPLKCPTSLQDFHEYANVSRHMLASPVR